jgi:homoserine kinase
MTAFGVRVPASSSNLGAGFDCIGVAIERWLTALATADAGGAISIRRAGCLGDLTLPVEEDLIARGFRATCDAAGAPPGGVAIDATSDIPVGRGLGSSAAAIVAGALLADATLGLRMSREQIVEIATRVEGHPDNVAPAVYGGAVLSVRGPGAELVSRPLAVAAEIELVLAVPSYSTDTKAARAALPKSLSYADAVLAASRSAALVQGLASGDGALLAAGLDDVLHVPFRKTAIPGYDEVVNSARGAGAFGATLSGAGSAIVAIAPRERGGAVGAAMQETWRARGIQAELIRCPQPAAGAAVTAASGDTMSVTLQLPAVLAKLADGRRTLEARGDTLGDVVADVAARFPSLAPRLRDGTGQPYPFVTFYVNDDDARLRGGFAASLRDGDEIIIVPAIAGG